MAEKSAEARIAEVTAYLEAGAQVYQAVEEMYRTLDNEAGNLAADVYALCRSDLDNARRMLTGEATAEEILAEGV